jgi:flagellar basal-body rod modification protein FlgD
LDITPAQPLTPQAASQTQAAPATSGTEPAASVLTSDFETFLRMLTTQMENQDPLDPMKSDQFALQLATFSGVEQQVLTNELLGRLSDPAGASGVAGLADWVGKEVRAPAPLSFDGTPVTLYPAPPAGADRAELVVRDAAGQEVQRLPLPVSDEPVTWSGEGPGGPPLLGGLYSFSLETFAGDQPLAPVPVDRYGLVAEALRDGDAPRLRLADGSEVALDTVSAVRHPSEG